MYLSKILKISFAILILIILGEIGYYIYVQNQSNKKQGQELAQTARDFNIPETPLLQSKAEDQLSTKYQISTERIGSVLREASIAASMVKSGILASSVRQDRIRTKLNNIYLEPGKILSGQTYKAKLELQNGPNDIMNLFIFSDNDLSITRVVELLDNNIEKPIKLSDLKPGDVLGIETRRDLLKIPGTNLIEMKIVKI